MDIQRKVEVNTTLNNLSYILDDKCNDIAIKRDIKLMSLLDTSNKIDFEVKNTMIAIHRPNILFVELTDVVINVNRMSFEFIQKKEEFLIKNVGINGMILDTPKGKILKEIIHEDRISLDIIPIIYTVHPKMIRRFAARVTPNIF